MWPKRFTESGLSTVSSTRVIMRLLFLQFFAVILVLFVLNITSSALAFVFYENLEGLALNSLSLYNQTGEPYGAEITLGWNKLQEKVSTFTVL